MTPEQIAAALEPHARRPIRAFLANPKYPAAEDAFWDAIYDQRPLVDYGTAVAVAAALEGSGKRIRDVLDGYRPKELTQ